MFENLTDRLSQTLRHVTGKAKLTEDNIKDTLREVRMALLEADVALPVVKDFVNKVKERAVGTEVSKSLTPGQAFVKIVRAELEELMGAANEDLALSVAPPAVILMAGLQGAGKTTTAGKLARFLKERKKKSVMVVSADVYRPAAIKQLETLAGEVGVTFFPSDVSQKPVALQVASAPHGSSEDSTSASLPANYPYHTRMRRNEYEKAKHDLQIELLKVQSWVKETGQRVVVLFEGRDAAGKALPDTLEIGLLAQGRLLDEELRKIPASTPASELYALSLGGDGRQGVFLREADYAGDLLGQRFAARGVIRLVNHRDHFGDRPLATRESLSRAVRTLAERSGPEDLVFIYLTSHGSSDHQLALDMPGLNLGDLPAAELAELLAPLRQRDKVLVVSACYSGGFIPPLKDERTLILTAARADRVSFGCSDDADFTYFGRALLANALNRTDDLSKAFELAKEEVRQREKEEGFEASEPQAWLPERVLAHWRTLRGQQAERALASREGKTGEGAAGK